MIGNIDILVKELCKLPKEIGWALTNKSLRDRFNVGETSAGSISRLIKEAVSQGRIKALDPDTAKRYMRYIPIWA